MQPGTEIGLFSALPTFSRENKTKSGSRSAGPVTDKKKTKRSRSRTIFIAILCLSIWFDNNTGTHTQTHTYAGAQEKRKDMGMGMNLNTASNRKEAANVLLSSLALKLDGSPAPARLMQ